MSKQECKDEKREIAWFESTGEEPGPWHWEQWPSGLTLCNSYGQRIMGCLPIRDRDWPNRANGALMAAVPELKAQLAAVRAQRDTLVAVLLRVQDRLGMASGASAQAALWTCQDVKEMVQHALAEVAAQAGAA